LPSPQVCRHRHHYASLTLLKSRRPCDSYMAEVLIFDFNDLTVRSSFHVDASAVWMYRHTLRGCV
ncbi:putative transmembrane protein, partial [Toxoplasma gondii FOU]